jgi:type I restriction enzyme M protein
LHIVRSLKSTGTGVCVLPHGVLFRGNAEAEIRRALVRHGYIKGIIGLPANLFYGTGIPACIVVVDKQEAAARKGIFMIDASGGFMKDGPKNRLRAMDIHKIIDVFERRLELAGYSRMVPLEEIERNQFNLNIPRYIDGQAREDQQDIDAHLRGGIPEADVDALEHYWAVCPGLRTTLFAPERPGYLRLAVEPLRLGEAVREHPELVAFIRCMDDLFGAWRDRVEPELKALAPGFHPKELIVRLAEDILAHYRGQPLVDPYDVYQRLMDYWAETMQDDCYQIAADGWKAEPYRVIETDKKGRERDRGWACDLVPKPLVVRRWFAAEQQAIDAMGAKLETLLGQLQELEEEHGGDEGALGSLDAVNRGNVALRLKEIVDDPDAADEAATLRAWLEADAEQSSLRRRLKAAEAQLDALAYARYATLTVEEVRSLVVDDKWLATLAAGARAEVDRVTDQLTARVRELAERYETPLPTLVSRVAELEQRVSGHLARMGFAWS